MLRQEHPPAAHEPEMLLIEGEDGGGPERFGHRHDGAIHQAETDIGKFRVDLSRPGELCRPNGFGDVPAAVEIGEKRSSRLRAHARSHQVVDLDCNRHGNDEGVRDMALEEFDADRVMPVPTRDRREQRSRVADDDQRRCSVRYFSAFRPRSSTSASPAP